MRRSGKINDLRRISKISSSRLIRVSRNTPPRALNSFVPPSQHPTVAGACPEPVEGPIPDTNCRRSSPSVPAHPAASQPLASSHKSHLTQSHRRPSAISRPSLPVSRRKTKQLQNKPDRPESQESHARLSRPPLTPAARRDASPTPTQVPDPASAPAMRSVSWPVPTHLPQNQPLAIVSTISSAAGWYSPPSSRRPPHSAAFSIVHCQSSLAPPPPRPIGDRKLLVTND